MVGPSDVPRSVTSELFLSSRRETQRPHHHRSTHAAARPAAAVFAPRDGGYTEVKCCHDGEEAVSREA